VRNYLHLDFDTLLGGDRIAIVGDAKMQVAEQAETFASSTR
jgi:hypothetical protein